jgi:Pentapeptide repeats (8 copies)
MIKIKFLDGSEKEFKTLQYADLQDANLRSANLEGANLEGANLQDVNLRSADLQGANLRSVNLRGVNLQYADLQGANLQYADLQGANLDYSCWPLWCGTKNVKVDKKIASQLAMHFYWLDCNDEEVKKMQEAIKPLAMQCPHFKEKENLRA